MVKCGEERGPKYPWRDGQDNPFPNLEIPEGITVFEWTTVAGKVYIAYLGASGDTPEEARSILIDKILLMAVNEVDPPEAPHHLW